MKRDDKMNDNLKKYIELCTKLRAFEKEKIPLCAAETYVSNFCKSPLVSDFEGKYSFVDSLGNNSFIGGEFVNELNCLLKDECKLLFQANYANADTLTGINCFTICAMSLFNKTKKVLVTTPEQGGHASIPIILDTLGITYESIPYNYKKYQIDYCALNELCDSNRYQFLIFCQSDIINPPDLNEIKLPLDMGILYDATQTLGLIASKIIANPLHSTNNVVLIGGAHKTLPAPSCGLIMTNVIPYANKLKENITPNFLRNTQPNHIAALLLSLIEQEKFGVEYQSKVVSTANLLGQELENLNFHLAKLAPNKFTNTHQLFILMSKENVGRFYHNALKYNVTLNKKHKLLFTNDGIRLGTQEIARYNWNHNDITLLAKLLYYLNIGDKAADKIKYIRKQLIARKIPHFTYDEIIIE